MKIMLVTVTLSIIIFVGSVPAVKATSTDDLLLQIQSLLKIVQQLQVRLSKLNDDNVANYSLQTTNFVAKPQFCNTLSTIRFGIGYNSPQVSQLQQFLKRTGDFTYPEFTNYYGQATKQAVQRYQCREMGICSGLPNINGYGLAGPITRASMCERKSASLVQKTNLNTPTQTTKPPPSSVTAGGPSGGNSGKTPPAYSWDTSNWGQCVNSQQERTITCKDSNNNTVTDSKCTTSKPAVKQSCSVGSVQLQTTFTSNIWDVQDNYFGNFNVWNPLSMSYDSMYYSDVYQFDSPPYILKTDRQEMWTANYRCMHTNLTDKLGWHKTPSENKGDWQYGEQSPTWCQRVTLNPWLQPINYYSRLGRWWTQATAATWWSTQLWENDRPENFVLIRFTENKTIKGSDGLLRRAVPPLERWGYVNWKMDGTPANPDVIDNDSVTDGYYQGFITMSQLPINSGNNWGANSLADDLGPIVWPRRGYRQWRNDLGNPPGHGAAWQQTSVGVRHPNALTHDGYTYLFYLYDVGINNVGNFDDESQGGIFIARSPVSSGLIPGSWMCGREFDTPCLPANYSNKSREDFEASFSLEGPNVVPILDSKTYPGITSFSVAKFEDSNSPKFIGVSEQYNDNKHTIRLFTSNDLTHWIEYAIVYDKTGPWNMSGVLHYPRIINASNGNFEYVNRNHFFVIGSSGDGCDSWHCKINRIRIDF